MALGMDVGAPRGYIDAEEFKKAMLSQGEPLTPAELDDMIKAWDKNGDGKLDYKDQGAPPPTIWRSRGAQHHQ